MDMGQLDSGFPGLNHVTRHQPMVPSQYLCHHSPLTIFILPHPHYIPSYELLSIGSTGRYLRCVLMISDSPTARSTPTYQPELFELYGGKSKAKPPEGSWGTWKDLRPPICASLA